MSDRFWWEEERERVPEWKPQHGLGALLSHLQRIAIEKGHMRAEDAVSEPVKSMPPGREPGAEG